MTESVFAGQSGVKWTCRTDQILGEGGFGKVYAAEGSDGTSAAVKVVYKQRSFGVLDDRLLRREIEIGRKVRDSGNDMLLPVIDVAETSDALLLVILRADVPLSASLPMTEPDAITALIHIAVGLQQLHLAGIIHRDLKPPNVLLHAGYWKLADFGIARDQEIGTQDPTFIGAGSLPYMAPELWQLKSPTVKTDLYALGCLGFELLTDIPPFTGDLTALRAAHLTEAPPEAPCSNPIVKNLISRLLAKDPADRPQDARAVLERLRKAAVPRTPAQEAIARGLSSHHAERSRAAAAAAAAKADADTLHEQITQGKNDLLEIFNDALEDLQTVEPDATLENLLHESPTRNQHQLYMASAPTGSVKLSAADVHLEVNIWHSAESHSRTLQDGTLITGQIHISNPRHKPFLCGYIACMKVKGRFVWQVYRFRGKSLSRRYGGKFFRYSSLNNPDFSNIGIQHRKFHRVINELNIVAEVFAADAVLKIFQEAVDLNPLYPC